MDEGEVMSVLSTLRRVPPVWALLAATAALYLWGLSASGWANAYYTAAVQAGAESWRAFFFGSFDAAGSVTVDKPPLALWPMSLSVRLFGLSSWSVLVPQALMGVATVAIVHHTVRRVTGSDRAALLGGAAMALTPVAVLMFRFNNPDGLLVLLLTAAAAATLRALDSERAIWWITLAGTLIGLAFLTKMLQAFLVLPALGLTYLLFAAVPWRKRIVHLLAAFSAMVVAGSWWLIAVELWPASSRPWIGGSQHNSALELVIGYNGLGRLTGDQVGSVSSGRGWGNNTLLRLLDPDTGSQASWLLPAAFVLSGVALWLTRGTRDGAHDRARPAIVLWLTWTLITWLVFSLMSGIFHDYYTVALAPSISALVAISAHVLWQHRSEQAVTRALGAAVGVTGIMALVVLWSKRDWSPWLPWAVAALFAVAIYQVVVAHRRALPVGASFAAVAVGAAFVGPAAWSLETVATPHTGAIPHAGPPDPRKADVVFGPPVLRPYGSNVGDLLTASTASPRLTTLLTRDAADFTWVAAVTGANSAAGFQLATQRPVMPLGGFNGTDPAPGFRRFQRLVATGQVHWFIAGGGLLVKETTGEPGGVERTGSDASQLIESWVARHFEARVVDGVTVYNLAIDAPVPAPPGVHPFG
jgi:4-amino-4-deoxy-L-arabinose transferase-like glycosyltransferase